MSGSTSSVPTVYKIIRFRNLPKEWQDSVTTNATKTIKRLLRGKGKGKGTYSVDDMMVKVALAAPDTRTAWTYQEHLSRVPDDDVVAICIQNADDFESQYGKGSATRWETNMHYHGHPGSEFLINICFPKTTGAQGGSTTSQA